MSEWVVEQRVCPACEYGSESTWMVVYPLVFPGGIPCTQCGYMTTSADVFEEDYDENDPGPYPELNWPYDPIEDGPGPE